MKLPILLALVIAVGICPGPAVAGFNDPMTFRFQHDGGNSPESLWILAEGRIEANTVNGFASFLQAASTQTPAPGPGTIIRFNSPGGSINDGVRLGALIRSLGFNTRAEPIMVSFDNGAWLSQARAQPSDCHSACLYAFIGGLNRRVSPAAHFGVHQFSPGRSIVPNARDVDPNVYFAAAQSVTAFIFDHVRSMGVDTAILSLASKIPASGELYELSPAELAAYGIDNSRPAPAKWQLIPYGKGIGATIDQGQEDQTQATLTIFCDGRRFPYMTVHIKPAGRVLRQGFERQHQEIFLSVNGRSAQGSLHYFSGIQLSADGLEASYTVGLTKIGYDALAAGSSLLLEVPLPHAASETLGMTTAAPLGGARDMMVTTSRACAY